LKRALNAARCLEKAEIALKPTLLIGKAAEIRSKSRSQQEIRLKRALYAARYEEKADIVLKPALIIGQGG
jgi:hypothetical protein